MLNQMMGLISELEVVKLFSSLENFSGTWKDVDRFGMYVIWAPFQLESKRLFSMEWLNNFDKKRVMDAWHFLRIMEEILVCLVDFLLCLMNTPTISGLTKLIFGIEPGDRVLERFSCLRAEQWRSKEINWRIDFSFKALA